MLTLLSCADYTTGLVRTTEPFAIWSALNVAAYYQNKNLIFDDLCSKNHNWESISQSGIAKVSSDNQAMQTDTFIKNPLIGER